MIGLDDKKLSFFRLGFCTNRKKIEFFSIFLANGTNWPALLFIFDPSAQLTYPSNGNFVLKIAIPVQCQQQVHDQA